MFLADGSFWQVGLVSEEGARMDNAGASNSAASSLPAQRRRGRRIPVPIQHSGAVGTISANTNERQPARILSWGWGRGAIPI